MRQLVVLDLATDLSIGVACAAIAFALIHFARRPTVRPYGRVFVAFAVFVIADGATHLAAVWTLWQPSAWLATVLKLTTALAAVAVADRKSTRLNSSHGSTSYAVFCLKKKTDC